MGDSQNTRYAVMIRFVPGDGFYVATIVGSDRFETPDAFGTLEGAAQFVARHMAKAGYCTDIGAE
jgi:hypothetical protein